MVTVPVPNTNSFLTPVTLESPVMVSSPNPKVSGFGLGISTIASAVIPGLPILIVNSILVAVIVTLISYATVANENSEKAQNHNIYKPLKEAVR